MKDSDEGGASKGEGIALLTLLVSILGVVAAWLSVPGFPKLFDSQPKPKAPIIDNFRQAQPSKTPKSNDRGETGNDSAEPSVPNSATKLLEDQPKNRTSSTTPTVTTVSSTSRASKDVAQDGFVFGFPDCNASGGRINCEFTVTNVQNQVARIQLIKFEVAGSARSYLVDRKGHQYLAPGLTFGAVETADGLNSILNNFINQDLEPNIPMNAVFKFEAPASIESPVTVVIAYNITGNRHTAVFRGVILN